MGREGGTGEREGEKKGEEYENEERRAETGKDGRERG